MKTFGIQSLRGIRPTALALAIAVAGVATAGTPAHACKSHHPAERTNASGVAATAAHLVPSRKIELQQYGAPYDYAEKQLTYFDRTPLQSTGYWADKGDRLVVTFDSTGDGPDFMPELWIIRPDDNRYHFGKAQKVRLKKGENRINVQQMGVIYFAVFNRPTNEKLTVNLREGGRIMPHFVLGKHTHADWQSMIAAYGDAPFSELRSDRVVVLSRTARAKSFVDDAPATMQTWEKLLRLAEEQRGIGPDKAKPHRSDSRPFIHWRDGYSLADDCVGFMNSGSYGLATCSDDGMKYVLTNAILDTQSWGPWHELGHQFQMLPMRWDGMTEVTVNLASLYIQRTLAKEKHGAQWKEKWGELSELEKEDGDRSVWSYIFDYLAEDQRDYDEQWVWVKLGMVWQLDLAFGEDFYAKLGTRYRDAMKNGEDLPLNSSQSAEKKQGFIYEATRIAGYDLTPFFEKWGLTISQQTRSKIRQLGLPVLPDPIWENRDSDIKYTYYDQQPSQPTASAGRAWNVVSTSNWGFAYKLDGSGSKGDELTYQWRQVSGPFSLRKSDQAQAEAVVPKNSTGTSVYELTVTDEIGRTAKATTTVSAVAPEAGIAGNASVPHGTAASLSAQANFSGGKMSYAWTLRNASGTVAATGSNSTLAIPADLAVGDYAVELTVKSTSGARVASASRTLKVVEASVPDQNAAFFESLRIAQNGGTDHGNRVSFSLGVTHDRDHPPANPPAYHWTLPGGAVNAQISQNQASFDMPKSAHEQNVAASVKVMLGERSKTLQVSLKVAAGEGKPGGGNDGDTYPMYVEGAASQKPGTIVRSRDGKLYQCKPAPHGGWCAIRSALYYEPGFGLAWRDAWTPYRD